MHAEMHASKYTAGYMHDLQKRRGKIVDWNSRPVAEAFELHRTKGLSSKDTYRELVRRGVRVSYEAVRIRLRKLDLEAECRARNSVSLSNEKKIQS